MTTTGRFPFRIWYILLAAGILLRLALPWLIPQTPFQGDGYEYFRYADNLVRHGTYSDDFSDPRPGAGRVPGVPFLVLPVLPWAAGQQPWVALPVTLCSILSLLVVARLLRVREEISLKWKAPALAMYALLPVYDLYNGRFYPDVPAGTALLLLLAWLWSAPAKYRSSVWFPLVSGALVGISAFFRPEMVVHVLMPVIWAWEWGTFRPAVHLRTLALSVAGLGMVLAPWTIRNAIQFGKFIPLDQPYLMDGSSTAPDRSDACATGLYAWVNTWYTRESEIKSVAWDFMHADLDRLPSGAFRSDVEKEEIRSLQADSLYCCGADRKLAEIAAERRSEAPFQYYFLLPAQRSLRLLFRTELPDGKALIVAGMLFLLAFQWLVHAAVLWGMSRLRIHPILPVAAFLLFYRLVLFSLVHHVEYRYMLSVFPVLFLAAGVAIAYRART